MAEQDKPGSREGRIAADTSIARHAASDFGPQGQPIVDAPVEPAGVTAKFRGYAAVIGSGTMSGQLYVENRSDIDLEIYSVTPHVAPASSGGLVSLPFVAGPSSPPIRLDHGDMAVLSPIALTVHGPGRYVLGATVRLRERGSGPGIFGHVEAESFPVAITPR